MQHNSCGIKRHCIPNETNNLLKIKPLNYKINDVMFLLYFYFLFFFFTQI